jgi:2-amino-4-hydroxy-6-hydroxymethyldihydropteridine diphosphokinase
MNFSQAILSLGSSQGDRLAWLDQARDALDRLPDVRVRECSRVYETDPVDAPEAFAHLRYLNQVLIAETALDADAFSTAVHAVEQRLGRERGPAPNLPRTIDIDIVTFGALRSDAPHLTLPHPRARTRRFVLQPLADLRPDFILPGETLTVAELLRCLPETPGVTRLA